MDNRLGFEMNRLEYNGYLYYCHIEFSPGRDGKGRVAFVIPYRDGQRELYLIGKSFLEAMFEIKKFENSLHELSRIKSYRDKNWPIEEKPKKSRKIYPEYLRLVK
jgi:hypothetical protein